MAPELVVKQCRILEPFAASWARNSESSMLFELYWRLPSITTSPRADSRAARTMPGSPCPNMLTPMPLIMSHFTDPSTSSTRGPRPIPLPTYG
jgi:hypothetical protein